MSFLSGIRLRQFADQAVAVLRQANRHAPRTFDLKAPHNISGVRKALEDWPRAGGYLGERNELPLHVVRPGVEGAQRGEVAAPLAYHVDEAERAAMKDWLRQMAEHTALNPSPPT